MDHDSVAKTGFTGGRLTYGHTKLAALPPCFQMRFFVLGLMALAAIGCGGNSESTVSGMVSLNGTPLDHGSVTFVPMTSSGKASASQIDSDGSYAVQAGQSGGLPAGEYSVKVSSRAPAKLHPQGGPSTPGKLLTPKRYRKTSTSGLKFTVSPGSNDIDLDLTSK